MEDRAGRRCGLLVCGVLGTTTYRKGPNPLFFYRTADLIAQKLGDLGAECDVIKNKTTDVMFLVMLDYEKAFV
jgi:hypothetical protein